MKTILKATLIFSIVIFFSVFQACWDNCDESIWYTHIENFTVHSYWKENGTKKYDSINFSLEFQGFTYYTCLNNNFTFINKSYALYPHYNLIDSIASISIYSNANYDSLHPAGTLLNDIILIRLYYYEPYLNINSDINDTLSNIIFPVRSHFNLFFKLLNKFPPDTTLLHQFTIIYKETDSTILTYKLPSLYIEP